MTHGNFVAIMIQFVSIGGLKDAPVSAAVRQAVYSGAESILSSTQVEKNRKTSTYARLAVHSSL